MDKVIFNSGKNLLASTAVGWTGTPNALYVEYCNGTPVKPDIQTTRTRAYYTGLTGNYWYARCTATGASASGNKALFVDRVTPASKAPGRAGAPDITDQSKIYSVTLVYAPDLTDPSKDIIIAAQNIVDGSANIAPIQFVTNMGLTATISLEF